MKRQRTIKKIPFRFTGRADLNRASPNTPKVVVVDGTQLFNADRKFIVAQTQA
jgi:hypothetical protein